MNKPAPPPDETLAFEAVARAYRTKRVIFFTDPKVLNRPGSPVYSPIDVFAPALVLMGSSLTLLFAFGLIEWMLALTLALLYQVFLAPWLVEWRMHRRTVQAAVRNLHNLKLLWEIGGIAIAITDFPEKNCVAPRGKWREFAAEWLMDASPQDNPPNTPQDTTTTILAPGD